MCVYVCACTHISVRVYCIITLPLNKAMQWRGRGWGSGGWSPPPPPHNFRAQFNKVISHMNSFKPSKHKTYNKTNTRPWRPPITKTSSFTTHHWYEMYMYNVPSNLHTHTHTHIRTSTLEVELMQGVWVSMYVCVFASLPVPRYDEIVGVHRPNDHQQEIPQVPSWWGRG